MKFIHTADWHLGRILFGVHLTEDQEYLLNQLEKIIITKRPDALIIAGDIYDRAVPPPSAIKLLDEFLSRIVHQLKTPVIMIAGNHDSPDRLGFASKILEEQGLFIKGSIFSNPFVTQIKDQFGAVDIYALPYAEPVVVREKLSDDTIVDHHLSMKALVDDIRKQTGKKKKNRKILITHAFVAGGSETESERPLSVGGSGAVPVSVFKGFDYVALGHLHRSQTAGSKTIRYPGSILPYSFEEGTIEKSVTFVELGQDSCHSETIPLTPKRKLRIVKGEIDELLKNNNPSDDYIQATLLDKGPVFDAMGKLRDIFPNILHIERPYIVPDATGKGLTKDHRKLDEKELFSLFFKDVTGEDPEDDLQEKYIDIIDDFKRRNREAVQ